MDDDDMEEAVIMPYEGAKDGKHYWLTPPDLMAKLDSEFHFDFDPCPYPLPDGFDGLIVEWGESNYVNPPFQGPTKWVRKAIEEYRKGKKVVFVFPIDKWVHYFIEAGAEIRNLRDVKWCAVEDGQPGKGMGRWIACFVLDPERRNNERGAAIAQAHGGNHCAAGTGASIGGDVLGIYDDKAGGSPGGSMGIERQGYNYDSNLLSPDEKKALAFLIEAWDIFVALPILHDDDQVEFRRAIHAAQNIIMARPALREYRRVGQNEDLPPAR